MKYDGVDKHPYGHKLRLRKKKSSISRAAGFCQAFDVTTCSRRSDKICPLSIDDINKIISQHFLFTVPQLS